MRLLALYVTNIVVGFSMMALEIMGGRVLYPVFGSSIDVWAAVISVFILSLSIGYVLGGRIADRMRSNRGLGWILVAAGIAYCLLPLIALPLQLALGEHVAQSQWGALVAALLLFLLPSLLLGALSPILVRLVFVSAERVGRTTGTLYAVGSIGSVLGVLVSDYVLMKHFDNNTNIWTLGVALLVFGIGHLLRPIAADASERRLSAREAPTIIVGGGAA